jgi:hypothetical protein
MNLRKATLFLILAQFYTVLHKALFTFFHSLGDSQIARSVTSALWLVATLALVLFAYRFLAELSPRGRPLRYSLYLIIVFTCAVIVSKLPIWPTYDGGMVRRMVFGFSGLLNAFAILVFLISFAGHVTRESPLWTPVRSSIWACGLTAALGLVSTGYFAAFVITGREVQSLGFLRPLAAIVFAFTYVVTTWFLIRFRRVPDYRELALGESG